VNMEVQEDTHTKHVTPTTEQGEKEKWVLGSIDITAGDKRTMEALPENPTHEEWDTIILYMMKYIYLQTTLGCVPKGEIGVILKRLWEKYTGGLWEDASTQDDLNSTLLLLGGKGVGTAFHFDWSNAVNIAFALTEEQMQNKEPLALWSYLNPKVMTEKCLQDAFKKWCATFLTKYNDDPVDEDKQSLKKDNSKKKKKDKGLKRTGTHGPNQRQQR
jgi:hypothetical protein